MEGNLSPVFFLNAAMAGKEKVKKAEKFLAGNKN
jgi:hypothetical protein